MRDGALPYIPAYVDAEDFKTERLKAGLTKCAVGGLVGVSERTVRNWEAGRGRIPYSAFKLMRILRGYALPGQAWEGFQLRGDTIWSPDGKSFSAADLSWWSLTCGMARAFRTLHTRHGSQAAVAAIRPGFPVDGVAPAALAAGGGGVSTPARSVSNVDHPASKRRARSVAERNADSRYGLCHHGKSVRRASGARAARPARPAS